MGYADFVLRLQNKTAFRGIVAGDKVRFKVDGKVYQAKVNALLIFENHVMVNRGAFGTYVDENNYVSHKA